MYKKILVALDISDKKGATWVAKRASLLAKLSGAEVHTVSIIPDFGTSMVGAFFSSEHKKQALHKLGEDIQKFNALAFDSDVNVRPHVLSGSIYEEIIRASTKLDVDLIVIGAHRPKLSDYLLGPNAARVVRHSPISVLVVRS